MRAAWLLVSVMFVCAAVWAALVSDWLLVVVLSALGVEAAVRSARRPKP